MPRSKPFSGKAKKEQLQQKRAAKRDHQDGGEAQNDDHPAGVPTFLTAAVSKSGARNRHSTVFAREENTNVESRRIRAQEMLDVSKRGQPLHATLSVNEDPVLDHPKGVLLRRGSWSRELLVNGTAQQVEQAEFNQWLERIYKSYTREQLNSFEHNMEVWMQLWHTLATADVICLICDIRNPLWHIPKSLYAQITTELRKPLVIVLNKCDLVPKTVVNGWMAWLTKRYPDAVFVPFSASGADLEGATSLALRRRALRAARTAFDTAIVHRRSASVQGLLRAAGAPPECIADAAARLESSVRVGDKRDDAALCGDMPLLRAAREATEEGEDNSNEAGAAEESEEAEDAGASAGELEAVLEECEGVDEEDEGGETGTGGSLVDGDEGDGDGIEAAHTETDTGRENASGRDSADEEEEEDDVLILVHSRAEERKSRALTAMSGALVSAAPVRPAQRPACSPDSDSDERERFTGRPRRYKRGDASKMVAALESSAGGAVHGLAQGRGTGGMSDSDTGNARGGGGGGGGIRGSKKGKKTGKHKETKAPAGSGRPPRADAPAPVRVPVTLTIGMVGHPNVGKSSVINALVGEKRVSVSRTAGHTKRAQTIHLFPGVALLDCPGLVFPHALVPPPIQDSLAPRSSTAVPNDMERAMQECCGVVPLAQVREPYTGVRLLGEYLPLERMYGIHVQLAHMMGRGGSQGGAHGESGRAFEGGERSVGAPLAGYDDVLSPLLLCEALATKRGRFLAKTGRPDAHAAGREILYDAQDGIIPLWWLPPPLSKEEGGLQVERPTEDVLP